MCPIHLKKRTGDATVQRARACDHFIPLSWGLVDFNIPVIVNSIFACGPWDISRNIPEQPGALRRALW
jgi:hypothetical protein